MADWLHRHNQPAAAVERFWHVVLVSALSESLDRTSRRALHVHLPRRDVKLLQKALDALLTTR